jgi:hypothetical protein
MMKRYAKGEETLCKRLGNAMLKGKETLYKK